MTHYHVVMDQLLRSLERNAHKIVFLFFTDRFWLANILTDSTSDTFALTKIDPLLIRGGEQRIGRTELRTLSTIGASIKIDSFIKE